MSYIIIPTFLIVGLLLIAYRIFRERNKEKSLRDGNHISGDG